MDCHAVKPEPATGLSLSEPPGLVGGSNAVLEVECTYGTNHWGLTDAPAPRVVGFTLVIHERCRSGLPSHIAFLARGVSSPSTVESARRVLPSSLGLGQSPPSKPVIHALLAWFTPIQFAVSEGPIVKLPVVVDGRAYPTPQSTETSRLDGATANWCPRVHPVTHTLFVARQERGAHQPLVRERARDPGSTRGVHSLVAICHWRHQGRGMLRAHPVPG